jgi:hypothetical protein
LIELPGVVQFTTPGITLERGAGSPISDNYTNTLCSFIPGTLKSDSRMVLPSTMPRFVGH